MQESDFSNHIACAPFKYERVSQTDEDDTQHTECFSGYFVVYGANGNKTKYLEKDITITFTKDGDSKVKVVGIGMNKIGKFTLEGTLDEKTREMNVKRQYSLKKKDQRRRVARELGLVTTTPPAFSSKPSDYVQGPVDRSVRVVLERLAKILSEVMSMDVGKWFCMPVNAQALGLLDYHTIIERAMDLGTVKSQYAGGVYSSPQDMNDDIMLTFSNAIHYNPRGTEVYRMSVLLQDKYQEKYEALLKDPIASAISTPAQSSLVHRIIGKRHSTPKIVYDPEDHPTDDDTEGKHKRRRKSEDGPTEKDMKKLREQVKKMSELLRVESNLQVRNATPDEKRRLGRDIQSLPEEKVNRVIEIIQKNGITLPQNEMGEVELDLDLLDYPIIQKLRKYISRHL